MADFEVVTLPYAGKIKSFCEYLDRLLKSSGNLGVTKIGMAEWKLIGDGYSRAKIRIYPRGNYIVCEFKTDIDTIALGHPHSRNMAERAGFKLERKIRTAIENAKIMMLEEASTKPTSTIHADEKEILECPGCSGTLNWNMNFCPFCGLKLVKCIVCNHIIDKDQEIAICSHCAGSAHRDHLLEYLKVKGRCPSCGKELKKDELV
nr:hypothetical protein [Candidatus Freyarchaeota archaeon]